MPQPIKIKINLYKLTRLLEVHTLPELLAQIQVDDLAGRVRRIGYHDIRLEQLVAPQSAGNPTPYWLLDFVKLRMDHGPGKVGPNTPIEGFPLGQNEGFGEETAAIFDPVRNYMLVQYNHHGVRGPTIERYFNHYDDQMVEQFNLQIKLDDTSDAKLAQKQFITKLSVKIAPGKMTAAHRHNNVSLERALALNDDQHGNTVEFTLAASRGQCLANGPIHRMLDALRAWRQADQDQDSVVLDQFEVEAKANLADRAEKIDMLLPALQAQVDGIVMGADRRYTVRSRWDALLRARNGWDAIIRR